ncbi:MAG: hypothetical protein HIU82_10025 [Proteobacteria bacterium]|nr:hypothetical protein [Pseudomonadota bacterium]
MQTYLADSPRDCPAPRSVVVPSAAGPAPFCAPRRRALAGLAAAGALATLLAGCAAKPPPPLAVRSGAPVYAIDLTGGAKLCTAPQPQLAAGKTTVVAMRVGNDGGWCGIRLIQPGTAAEPKPYAAGLLLAPALHGTVYIHTVGDLTRVDYTPRPGFTGPDHFTVALLPGHPVMKVSVTVVR